MNLRHDAVAGALLLLAAATALIWANSGAAATYEALRSWEFGYEPWHLRMSLSHWVSDGLLAVFFFLVGLELKRHFVKGELRKPGQAIVPIAAAIGGVAVPALIYLSITSGPELRGWAIPTATDIAFALAVLAVVASRLPIALRLFLLTLAIVDDLIAIVIIGVFYTDTLNLTALAWALVPAALFAFLTYGGPNFFVRYRWAPWVLMFPVGAIFWLLIHMAGIHATVAGVILGFLVPVGAGLSEVLEHRYQLMSALLVLPIFAFFAAGVPLGGVEGISNALSHPIALGVMAGLVLGKPLGVIATVWLVTRFRGVRLDPGLTWSDVAGLGLLAGIGFTVSLLIAELSFETATLAGDYAKIGIMSGSLLAAFLAAAFLLPRNLRVRREALSNTTSRQQ